MVLTMTESHTVLEEILSAETHYGILGVAEYESDNATLRKAYLRRSLKAHPDKNPAPNKERATVAFQKVAQAWQILGDDAKRNAYNEALQRTGPQAADMQEDFAYYDEDQEASGQQRHRYAQRDETFYGGPPPTMQESLFMFASVVGSMMGGKTAVNLAEAMFWAEKLLNRTDAEGNTSRGLNLESLEDMSTKDKATLAMAVGSGLKVASSAARSLGMRNSAATLEKTAQMAQMVGVAGMVAEQPAVQKVLQQGSEGWQKLRSGLNAVKTVLQKEEKDPNDFGLLFACPALSNRHFDPRYISRTEFAQHWHSIVPQQSLSAPPERLQQQTEAWLDRLWTLHTESTRHYHTARHLQEMWQYLDAVQQPLSLTNLHYSSLLFAIYFHDAIYIPQSSTNEADSASLWQSCAADLDVSDATTKIVTTMILATQAHCLPDYDKDDNEAQSEAFVTQLFLDLDLAVLGKDEAAYTAYAAAIRREYAFVPAQEYCNKRAGILQKMLDQSEFLFGNSIFFDTLENRARNNVRGEILMLQRGQILL